MSAKLEQVAEAAASELVITRILDAPRALVFRMWSEAEHMRRWSAPQGFSQPGGDADFRVGGRWRAHMRSGDGEDFHLTGVYREIVPNERLVFTHAWLDGAGEPGPETLVTVSFEDQGKKTKMTFRQSGFASKASRDGHAQGWQSTFESLDLYLAEIQGAQVMTRKSATPPPTAFAIERAFAAPLDLVWRAHAEAEHLRHWWGPKGCKIGVSALEFRPGGLFHYVMRYSTGVEMWGRFFYRDIAAPTRLVYLSSFSNEAGGIARAPFSAVCPLELENTITFTEEAGKTTLHLLSRPFGATPVEEKFYADLTPSLAQGYGGTYDQLEAYLRREPSS